MNAGEPEGFVCFLFEGRLQGVDFTLMVSWSLARRKRRLLRRNRRFDENHSPIRNRVDCFNGRKGAN